MKERHKGTHKIYNHSVRELHPLLKCAKIHYDLKNEDYERITSLSISNTVYFQPMYEQEDLERKKAEYVEKLKNKIALIHKDAEEKRATTEARRGEDLLKAEELAAKYRATGTAPKKLLGCF